MKFENTEVWGFEHAIRGMRNPMQSWDKSDSFVCYGGDKFEYCKYNGGKCIREINKDFNANVIYVGYEDLKLMQQLARLGSTHRKFMRQIFVSVDITAPLYWWKEFDTYEIGTVANSTGTMHTLSNIPITVECFEMDDYAGMNIMFDDRFHTNATHIWEDLIEFCEKLRLCYLETKDKKYWKELIRMLPESWLQRRTVTMNYENLISICSKDQRRKHKLNEWSGMDNPNLPNFISWARTLPYAQELIFIDEIY